MAEHIIAVFETEANAASAVRSLQIAGIPPASIRQYSGDQAERAGLVTQTQEHEGGFWAWLFGEEPVSETTRSAYAGDMDMYDRRVRAGNRIVSVMVEDSMIHETIEILNRYSPVNIDESTDEYGYHPGTSGDPSTGAAGMGTGTLGTAGLGTPGGYATPPETSSRFGTGTRADAAAAREEVIPLAEEQLDIGKRTVDRGTTTIRRYVVEKPIERDVTLRDERVTVERRRPLETNSPETGSFEERVIEVRQTREEPVVAKTAKVVEEVMIGREATERTETVRDTVRKEEVEITGNDSVTPTKPAN